jgi:hypothetical protein
MVSTSSSPLAAASGIFSGLETGFSAGHPPLRDSAAVDQHSSDGRRVLVAIHKAGKLDPAIMSHVPDWLQWLKLSAVAHCGISVLLVFGYFFSTIANWIAAPFNGLLAEQLEARLTGATPPDTGVLGIMKDIPRIMKREWQKFAWYLPRASAAYPLFCARHWPDGGPGAVVPVQRLDAGHPVL